MRADVAFGVDQVELAMFAPGIVGQELAHDVVRRQTLRQQREPARAIKRIEQRLRRQRSDPTVRIRTKRPDGKKRLATTTPNAPLGSRATIDQVMCGSRRR